jgi:transglutaminase-like putative cysteine protease
MYADTRAHEFVVSEGVEKCLVGRSDYQTLRNIWSFVRNNVQYRQDRPGHEKVKSPAALFAVGHGDCKSFSVAIAAILRHLGIPYKYRFTAYSPGDYTHVYVVAYPKGNQPVIMDAVHTKFDDEVPYQRKKDYTPQPAVNTTAYTTGVHGVGEVKFDYTPILVGGILLLIGIEIFRG